MNKSRKLYNSILRQRNKRFLKMLTQGMTMQEIADKEGITKSRVSQIIQSLKGEPYWIGGNRKGY